MILCIVGPSGIGKTQLSIDLAKKYNAIIINADATQIYQELNIGSAKITEEEKCGIPHYLFDIKNPLEDYSVADYQKDARKILEEYKDRNIVVVGGTGLYIRALFYDYEFEDKIKKDYSMYSNEQLYQMALDIDPNIDIHKNNRVRLENFVDANGNIKKDSKPIYDVIYIGLTTDRDNLYNILDKRVDKMFDNGLVEEVTNLYHKYPNSSILKRAIGYKEIISYLNKEISLDDAKELIKKNTRHYAKRQYTWFNNQIDVKWFNKDDNLLNNVYEFISELNSK